MRLCVVVPALALGLSVPAWAEMPVGDSFLMADRGAIASRCATLAMGARPTSPPNAGNSDYDPPPVGAMSGTNPGRIPTFGNEGNAEAQDMQRRHASARFAGLGVGPSPASGNANQDGFSGMDLQSITPGDCVKAGFLQGGL